MLISSFKFHILHHWGYGLRDACVSWKAVHAIPESFVQSVLSCFTEQQLNTKLVIKK